jgi:hypothetical protein
MSINDDIMKFIRERQAAGERKYGKTIERDDLRPAEWANHALEEMADGIQYAVRCVETVERLEYAANLALSEFTAQIAKMTDGAEKERIVGIARKLVVALDGGDKRPVGLPWHEAPDWAMWAAMDSDGTWYWYENDPKIGVVSGLIIGWLDDGDRFGEFLASPCDDWQASKQRRPE